MYRFLPLSDNGTVAFDDFLIHSYIGSPKPFLLNCTFSNFPESTVTLSKNEQVLISGKSPVYWKVTTNTKKDFGEYVCSSDGGSNGEATYSHSFVEAGTLGDLFSTIHLL